MNSVSVIDGSRVLPQAASTFNQKKRTREDFEKTKAEIPKQVTTDRGYKKLKSNEEDDGDKNIYLKKRPLVNFY
jgi:IS5 family transposase